MDERSISGILVMLGNKTNDVAVPLYWKSKMVVWVCHSAKASEPQGVIKIMDDIQFFAIQVEQLLYGSYGPRILIKLFTDSKPLLESIGSIHQVEEKMLRKGIMDMKHKLYDGFIESFSWLDGSKDMVVDTLTKECKFNQDLEDIVLKNKFCLGGHEDNIVRCMDSEIKIQNKHNKLD
jgi:hypothetical protein